MILRRYGLTLNFKCGTIEHNEHRDMVFTTFHGAFSTLTLLLLLLCTLAVHNGSIWLCNRVSARSPFQPNVILSSCFPNHNNQTVSSQAKYRLMTSSALVDKTQLTILHLFPFLLTDLMHKMCVWLQILLSSTKTGFGLKTLNRIPEEEIKV